MKISSQSRYALRLMLDIAQQGEGAVVSLKEISGRQNISVKYLEQIILKLNKTGYLKSVRGASGGYMLTRPPAEYSIGEMLRVVEGSLAPINCLKSETNQCEHSAQCGTLWFWAGMDKAINDYVDRYTLQDFLDHSEKNL